MPRNNRDPKEINVTASFSPSMSIEKLHKLIKEKRIETALYSDETKNEVPILEEINRRGKLLKNKALDQDISLKKWTLIALFIFLAIETLLIFFYSFLQATMFLSFELEEWSFKLLVTATLLQITFMLQVAVKHLFPNK